MKLGLSNKPCILSHNRGIGRRQGGNAGLLTFALAIPAFLKNIRDTHFPLKIACNLRCCRSPIVGAHELSQGETLALHLLTTPHHLDNTISRVFF